MAHAGKTSKILFCTKSGLAVPAVTAAEMREIDRLAVEETGPDLLQMMENAGRNLALLAIEQLGEKWKHAIYMVLAGSGGNGGGGICAARHLANRNLNVHLCLAEPSHMSEAAQLQLKIFRFAGGSVIAREVLLGQRPHIILDALIDYGLKSSPTTRIAKMIDWANCSGAAILALDVPSGVDATTGVPPGAFIRPQWTMTLALPKTGLLPGATGALYLADIGIPKEVYKRMQLDYQTPFENRYRIRLEQHVSQGEES